MAEPMTEERVLLEQYKLYVEMADRVSSRRVQTNRFYVTLLSGILAVVAVIIEKNLLSKVQAPILMAMSLLGIFLNTLWFVNIRSYRQLNTAKFKVIHEMEKRLPFAGYDREWEFLGRGHDKSKYLQLTLSESYVPCLLILPYLVLLFYSFTLL
ncbi:hypothetical protein MJD09_19700 [bacterium]|nr:hypothetical protein [bacterium]